VGCDDMEKGKKVSKRNYFMKKQFQKIKKAEQKIILTNKLRRLSTIETYGITKQSSKQEFFCEIFLKKNCQIRSGSLKANLRHS
jgi:hypothetical protein